MRERERKRRRDRILNRNNYNGNNVNSVKLRERLTSSKRFPIAPASSLLVSKFCTKRQSKINIKKWRNEGTKSGREMDKRKQS